MRITKKRFIFALLLFLLSGIIIFAGYFITKRFSRSLEYTMLKQKLKVDVQPPSSYQKPPPAKILENDYQIYQTFNNCGPASLSMTLSYFNVYKTQQELGESLRPYQNPQGDNDDKSVTLAELGNKAEEFGLVAYHRPNGKIELLKQFIANDIPVITQTWLKKNEDIGHYRVVKGYNDNTQQIIQDDSFEGHNIYFSYQAFNTLWGKYNYEYLVLVPKERAAIAEQILGEDIDEQHAWQEAIKLSEKQLGKNPENIAAQFNLSVAYYNTKDYKKSIESFEKVENKLPFRTLWYQTEPILAYYELKNYDRVFAITDKILNNGNRAFPELYLIRGNIYNNQGNKQKAKEEFEKAVFYNKHLKEAQKALDSL